MLDAKNFNFSCIITTSTVFSPDSFVINIASMLLFIIIMTATCLPVPAVNILYFLSIPVVEFWYSYGCCINIRSGSSSSIFYIRLSVPDLEWRKFI